MAGCSCSIAGLLDPGLDGIISATIDAGTDIKVTQDGIILIGPTIGSINISAHPFPKGTTNLVNYFGVGCPFRAGGGMNWIQKYDCDADRYYFIPVTGGTAWYEGDLPAQFSAGELITQYNSLNANVSSGPVTPIISTTHYDVVSLTYNGPPLAVTSGIPQSYFSYFQDILPGDAIATEVFLQSFSFDFTPPNSATVNYSFAFVYNVPT